MVSHKTLAPYISSFLSALLVIPEFSEEPSDENVTRTEDLQLNCSASGFLRPVIVWLHNGSEVEISSRVTIEESSSEVDTTSRLMITYTFSNDTGDYVCVAVTPVFGDVMSRVALVLIQGKPLLLCPLMSC